MLAACSASSSSATRLYIRSVGIVGQRRLLHAADASDPSPSTSSPSKHLLTPLALARTQHPLKRDGANETRSQFVESCCRVLAGLKTLIETEALREKTEMSRRQVRTTAITTQLNQQEAMTPAVVGNRIKEICEAEGIEKDVDMLKFFPLDLQDAVAWNRVITYAVKEGHLEFAFKLFNEMKRMGLLPTPSTYLIISGALSNSDSPCDHPKRIEMVHSLLEQYKRLVQSLTKRWTTIGGELIAAPFNLFIKYFTRLGDFDTVFDIYNSMEDECGVPPDRNTFSTLFYALLLRKTASKTDGLTNSQQNASDAKLLWRDVERARAKRKFELNERVLSPSAKTT